MTRFFKEPLCLVRRAPYGQSIDSLAEQLQEQGYSKASIRGRRRLVADFCCWVTLRRIDQHLLGHEHIGRYLQYRKRHRYSHTEDRRTLLRSLDVLIEQDLVPKREPAKPSPTELLEQDYRRYLQQERRLAPATIVHYLDISLRFLQHLSASGEIQRNRPLRTVIEV